jgi:hypothetical protein
MIDQKEVEEEQMEYEERSWKDGLRHLEGE